MKKCLLTAWLFTAGLMLANEVSAQSITIGTNQFASNYATGSGNDFGPMRTKGSSPASSRHAYIYPSSLLSSIPNNASISSLEFSRGGSVSNVASSLTPLQGTPNLKIYLRNVSINDYGSGAINWITRANEAKLVYNGNPAAFVDSTDGWKRIILDSSFIYQAGNNIEMLIEYVQPSGQLGDIRWFYNSDAAVPQYLANTTKYILTDSVGFPADSLTTRSQLRKPTVRFNFPYNNNVAIDRIFGSQYLLIGDTVTPSYYVKNTGLLPQTFTVTLEGPSGYISTKTVGTIAPDSLHFLEFDPISPTVAGNFTFKVYTNLSNDEFHGDDTLSLVAIVADPLVNSGVFDNGPIVTDPVGGYNGNALSLLSPPLSTLGLNGTIRTAEKFWLPENANYNIDSVGFWAYQTGSGFVSNFTEVKVMIYDGDPSNGGQLIFGDSIANILANTYFTGIMRASASSPLDSTRPIMRVLGEFLDPVVLQGGRPYWLVWNFTAGGTPFFPPITVPGVISSGDAIQRSSSTFVWSLGNGGGVGFPAGAPFQVYFRRDATSVNNLDPLAAKIGQLYPNPTSHAFSVAVDLQRAENVHLQLVDMQGREIATKHIGMLTAGNHLLEMPVAGLSPGMYFVKIRSGNFEVNRKLQVQ
jgi:hypothetical protein